MGEAEKYLAEILSGKTDFSTEPSNKPTYEELEAENKKLKAELERLKAGLLELISPAS